MPGLKGINALNVVVALFIMSQAVKYVFLVDGPGTLARERINYL
jgi:hypothetical protein